MMQIAEAFLAAGWERDSGIQYTGVAVQNIVNLHQILSLSRRTAFEDHAFLRIANDLVVCTELLYRVDVRSFPVETHPVQSFSRHHHLAPRHSLYSYCLTKALSLVYFDWETLP